jgi:hypothetical protein
VYLIDISVSQAVKDLRESQNVLVDPFGCMGLFFKRLETYIKVQPTAAMTDNIVKIMVEVLPILGIVTKEIRRGRITTSFPVNIYSIIDLHAEKFLKKLGGRKDVENALRLDRLTQEEARMAAAEILAKLTIRSRASTKKSFQSFKVSYTYINLPRTCPQLFSWLGVKETGGAIRPVVHQVNDMNRQ